MANFKLPNDTELARDVYNQLSGAGMSQLQHTTGNTENEYSNSESYILYWKMRNVTKDNEQDKWESGC